MCREECCYDLANLGFCAITGSNMEDQAAESNGAGKSALAMSAVWALTGHSDARIEVTLLLLLPFQGASLWVLGCTVI